MKHAQELINHIAQVDAAISVDASLEGITHEEWAKKHAVLLIWADKLVELGAKLQLEAQMPVKAKETPKKRKPRNIGYRAELLGEVSAGIKR